VDQPTPLYVEGDLLRQGGGFLPAGITYAPLFDREGRLVNLIGNVRDITKFREAEELKSTFISVISHELRTPVSLIKGYAETLRREDARWDSEVVKDGLAVIVEEADRLNEMVENMLDASRLQAGGMRLNMSEVALDRWRGAWWRSSARRPTSTSSRPISRRTSPLSSATRRA
jgi:K+-sensing histidine kinase KdpD